MAVALGTSPISLPQSAMFDSVRRRIAEARRNDRLFFAALISPETIASIFGSATAILDSARIYTTSVTVGFSLAGPSRGSWMCASRDAFDHVSFYDPSQYNDRLLLGLKGTMSEAELHILKSRLQQGM